jgi:cob(I)alamin adenosyltransferase
MLASGQKVPKDSLRIETYGTVDELNSFLGVLRDTLAADASKFKDLIERIARIQNETFDLGGELSMPPEKLDATKQQVVTQGSITRLENEIDEYNDKLPPLANFVLPGGHLANSSAHVCRTVCRRAERLVVALSREETVRDDVRIYLNRLSDWLFVASREISRRLGVPEVLWQQEHKAKRP